MTCLDLVYYRTTIYLQTYMWHVQYSIVTPSYIRDNNNLLHAS